MLVNLDRGELDGRRILRDESYDLLWTSTTDRDVGLSWFLYEEAGDWAVFHGGSDLGFRSHIVLLPNEGIGVVWASNWQLTDPQGQLAYDILDIVLPPDGE